MKFMVKKTLSPATRKNLYILKEKLERKEKLEIQTACISNMNDKAVEFGKSAVK